MFSSIRARIVALCVAIVVVALAANAVLNYVVANGYNTDSIDSSLTAVESGHVAGINQWVAVNSQMITSLQDTVLQPDPVPALKLMASAGNFTNVFVGYPDKTYKFSDLTGIPSNYDPTSRPWYKQAVAAGKPVVTQPYVSISNGHLIVSFASPVIRDGALKAVVSGTLEMDNVIANVKAIHPTPSSFGMLVNSSGLIVAHPDPKLTLKPVTDLMPELSADKLAALATAAHPLQVDVGGSPKLLRALPIAGTDWIAIVALDKAEATAGMRSLLTASIIALIVIAGLAAAVVAAVTAVSFRRLSEVRDAMDAIGSGEGDLTQRLPAIGSDEVAQIA
ncbi:MAG: cache domain-containing protein, partial [Paraburkholderia sp.]